MLQLNAQLKSLDSAVAAVKVAAKDVKNSADGQGLSAQLTANEVSGYGTGHLARFPPMRNHKLLWLPSCMATY